MPNYYTNSVFGPNISQFDANGPFWPMERGKDGRWAIVGFEVNEVGPKVVQPLRPTVHNVITYNPLNTAKPKSIRRPQSVFIIWVSYHGHLTHHDQAFKLRFENRKM